MPSIYPENLRSPFCSPFFDDILLITAQVPNPPIIRPDGGAGFLECDPLPLNFDPRFHCRPINSDATMSPDTSPVQ